MKFDPIITNLMVLEASKVQSLDLLNGKKHKKLGNLYRYAFIVSKYVNALKPINEGTADEIAELILSKITAEMPLEEGDEVSVLVNGLGATPLEELLIVFRKAALILQEKGVKIVMPHVGEYATSMEMAGLSITVFKLDEELKELLVSPASTPFYTNLNKI